MKLHKIGEGLEFSSIGVGGNIFGHFTDEDETREILNAARGMGMNFIDTADTYSDGRSEELIGACIKEEREYWRIATKVGIPHGEKPEGLGKRERIVKACEESLRRLGVEVIDLYQIHNFDVTTPLEETLGAFEELKKSGKIRAFGVSNYRIENLEELEEKLGKMECSTMQLPFNALAREYANAVIPKCVEMGIGVIPYNVLARGILTEKYLGDKIPEGSRAITSAGVRRGLVPEVLERVLKLKEIADELGVALGQLMIGCMLKQESVVALPLGMRNAKQVKESGKVVEVDKEIIDRIEVIVEGVKVEGKNALTSPVPR